MWFFIIASLFIKSTSQFFSFLFFIDVIYLGTLTFFTELICLKKGLNNYSNNKFYKHCICLKINILFKLFQSSAPTCWERPVLAESPCFSLVLKPTDALRHVSKLFSGICNTFLSNLSVYFIDMITFIKSMESMECIMKKSRITLLCVRYLTAFRMTLSHVVVSIET